MNKSGIELYESFSVIVLDMQIKLHLVIVSSSEMVTYGVTLSRHMPLMASGDHVGAPSPPGISILCSKEFASSSYAHSFLKKPNLLMN